MSGDSKWKWSIRAAVGDDLHFIYSTWLNSLWTDSQLKFAVRKTVFFTEYPKVIDRILADPGTMTHVACSALEANTIFGYLVTQNKSLIHYAFVKSIFRQCGIANALLAYSGASPLFTHRTGAIGPILDDHPEYSFNPFLLYQQASLGGSNGHAPDRNADDRSPAQGSPAESPAH